MNRFNTDTMEASIEKALEGKTFDEKKFDSVDELMTAALVAGQPSLLVLKAEDNAVYATSASKDDFTKSEQLAKIRASKATVKKITAVKGQPVEVSIGEDTFQVW